jgi:hypothetical protein
MKISVTRMHAFSDDSPGRRAYEHDFFASHIHFSFTIDPGEYLPDFPSDRVFEIPDRLPGIQALRFANELVKELPGEKSMVRVYSVDGRKMATYFKDGATLFKEDDFDCALCTSLECPLHIPEYLRMTVN